MTREAVLAAPKTIPRPLATRFALTFKPSGVHAKHGRVVRFEDFTIAQVHVNTTWQARIETSDRPHDVDTFELVGAVFFEDWGVLHRVFVGARRAINVTRVGV